jgi:hypothetical protein
MVAAPPGALPLLSSLSCQVKSHAPVPDPREWVSCWCQIRSGCFSSPGQRQRMLDQLVEAHTTGLGSNPAWGEFPPVGRKIAGADRVRVAGADRVRGVFSTGKLVASSLRKTVGGCRTPFFFPRAAATPVLPANFRGFDLLLVVLGHPVVFVITACY